MAVIKSSGADAYLARPAPGIFLYLVYGQDRGLVSERVKTIVSRAVDDPKDPFQLVRLDGDELAADRLRLADEANTIPLFGGRRAILIEAQGKLFHSAIEPLLALPPRHCTVVIEAGDLRKDAPLRALCERANTAVAVPCYPDSEAGIGQLIEAEVRAANLSITHDAKDFLTTQLGQDRLSTRGELEKLVLHCRGKGEITLPDVRAAVCDTSQILIQETVNEAFGGEIPALDASLRHVFAGAANFQVVLSAALRHALELHRAKAGAEGGFRAGWNKQR
ncbi:MAG: DNA polymerase III subunit delta, partial [Methylocapsa sp.]|nr:DNA polymerase III subunit delta [Methylocapsa sp.]